MVLEAALPERRHALILYFDESDVVSDERALVSIEKSGVSMQSISVNRREAYCSVAFTGLVVALGAVYAHSQSKFSPASQGSASWGAVTELSAGALDLGKSIRVRRCAPAFGGLARLEEVGFDPRRYGRFGPDRRESSMRVC